MNRGSSNLAAEELFTPEQWDALGAHMPLTPRQLTVARLLCAGCSQREMAGRLRLSRHTVGTHLRGLYRRLGVRSRVAVVIRLVLADRLLRDGGEYAAGIGRLAARSRNPTVNHQTMTGRAKRRAPGGHSRKHAN